MVNAYQDYHLDFIACHGDELEGTGAGAGSFIVAADWFIFCCSYYPSETHAQRLLQLLLA